MGMPSERSSWSNDSDEWRVDSGETNQKDKID